MFYKDKLIELREEKNQTQTNIAKILNISISLYSRYEKQGQIIPLNHLNTLSNYYNVSLDYIFNLTTEKQYSNTTNELNIEKFKNRFKNFRKDNKLTQVKLAKILNTTHSTLSAYENGYTTIITPFLYTICKKYNISADYLLGKTDNPKYLNN